MRHVVGIGQIVLIFYIMVATIGTVPLILGLEILWHKQGWQLAFGGREKCSAVVVCQLT